MTSKPQQLLLFFSKAKRLPKGHILQEDTPIRLSNFSNDSVELDSIIYPSVEHAYQAQKFTCTNRPDMVEKFYNGEIRTAEEAKSAGGKGGMAKVKATLDIACWDAKKDILMEKLLRSKITRNPEIKEMLRIAYDNNIKLVHFSRADMYWGAHTDIERTKITKGENKLGELYHKLMLELFA